MKNEAIKYLTAFTVLLLLTFNSVVACTQPAPAPSSPAPPRIQPPSTTSENKTLEETPPVNEAKDEEEWYTVETFSGEVSETTSTFHIYGTEWRITWTIDAEDAETAIFKLVIYQKDVPYAIWQTVSNQGSSSGEVNYLLYPEDKRDFFINVTAQNLRRWTIIVEDNALTVPSSPVQITYIFYKGTVYPRDSAKGICYKRVEPDEYVVIKNLSECYVDISGWVLKNKSKIFPSFTFPSCILIPGGIIRVYTDEFNPETGGFSFYYGPGNIWSNDKPDIAVLYDAQGNEVSRKSYTVPTKINEASQ